MTSLTLERLATLVPISPDFVPGTAFLAPDRAYVLSRFAYLRREGGAVVLESPLAHARVLLHDWQAAALVHRLARPCRPPQLAEELPAVSPRLAGEVLSLLLTAGMLADVDESGLSTEDESAALRSWEFHDLLFHSRSRAGRHDAPVGGTFRLLGQVDPPPVLKPAAGATALPLYRPDLDRLQREDPPYARVQEERCSIRDYGDPPLSDQQLGEFLYRVGRVADYWESDVQTPRGPVRMTFAPRPYPAPGALYELELYIAAHSCLNVARGLYRYDPERHQLNSVAGWTPPVEQLLVDAGRATAIPAERLQVLVVVAARFARIAWKYETIAYSLILKHVGVLYQTMYLAAAAMGLAPCAVGSGNADLFARAAGTDYYAETSVGEFLLGSRG